MSKFPYDITKIVDSDQLEINQVFKNDLRRRIINEKETHMSKLKKTLDSNFMQKFFRNLNMVSGLSIITLLVVVGGASALVSSRSTRLASERMTEIPTDLSGVLSISEIRDKALAAMPGGTINGVELENEHGTLLYKVRFSDGSFRLFDAKTGNPVNNTDNVETNASVPAGFVPAISLSEARTIAQNQRPGKTINKIELETEEGAVVYSVRFSDGGRVDVDANKGTILRVRNAEDKTSDDNLSDDNSSSSNSGSSDSEDDSDDDKSGSNSDSSGSGSDNSGSGSDDSGSSNR